MFDGLLLFLCHFAYVAYNQSVVNLKGEPFSIMWNLPINCGQQLAIVVQNER